MTRSLHSVGVAGLAAGLMMLAGCAGLAPEYKRPAAPVPEAWSETSTTADQTTGTKAASRISWREFFVDERLQKLIELALKNNRDLMVATLNIERTQALYRIKGSDLWPAIDASAGANWQRLPKDFSGTGEPKNVDQYTVGLGISSYELDFFGRIRSLKEQALQQYLATEQARRSVQISLIAQVAKGYLALAADRDRLQLARQTLTSQEASYNLINNRFEAGVANALDLSRARTSVEAARADIARYTAQVSQDRNGLELLVGSPVPTELLPPELGDQMTAIRDLPVGLPSEVLLERPDILQAEDLLKGANANIGAARAAFFPRITLVSNVGFGSGQLSDLFSSDSKAWSFAPRITLPIFNAGSNKAKLKVAKIDRDIAVARYEQTIQTAFREVADALAQRATIDDQFTAQQALVDATGNSMHLSQERFEKGVDSYLSVLDSQRALYAAQQSLIAVHLARLANLVTLYKVLGGGVN